MNRASDLDGYTELHTESSRGVQMSTKLLTEQKQVGQVAEIWGDLNRPHRKGGQGDSGKMTIAMSSCS